MHRSPLEWTLGGSANHRHTTRLVHDVNYGYNSVDQLISQQDTLRPAHTQVFGYVVPDRLKTASGSYGSQTYTLDANGNRSLTYNLANRLYSLNLSRLRFQHLRGHRVP